MTEKPNHLRLFGGPYNLGIPTCPTLFLRKQSSCKTTWRTQLSFQPQSSRTEAGTVLWWNYFTYSSLGIRLHPDDKSKRILRFKPAKGKEVIVLLKYTDSKVKLLIECGEAYKFGFSELLGEGEDEVQWIGEVDTEIMTADPLVGMSFSGMMLGLYAFGEMEGCLVPADFEYAEFM